MKGVDVGARFAPARELGGDFHDFLSPESNMLAVAVGDVSGKGVPAALYSVFAAELVRGRTFRRRYLPDRSGPASVLSSINTILRQRQLEEYYCTLCYAVFDFKRRTLTLANSGVPYPLHCSGTHRDDESRVLPSALEMPGVPLGLFQGSSYEELTVDLVQGDLFVFCTDGVHDATDESGEAFGEDRLKEVVRQSCQKSAGALVDDVFTAVQGFRGDAIPNDDLTVVALKITN